MKTPRKRYDQEFKRMIVELYKNGKTARSISEEFGIRVEFVSRWRRELDQYQKASFSGNGNPRMTEEQAEIARLKKELKEAQIERDILKKAGAAPQWASFPGTMANLCIYEAIRLPICY